MNKRSIVLLCVLAVLCPAATAPAANWVVTVTSANEDVVWVILEADLVTDCWPDPNHCLAGGGFQLSMTPCPLSAPSSGGTCTEEFPGYLVYTADYPVPHGSLVFGLQPGVGYTFWGTYEYHGIEGWWDMEQQMFICNVAVCDDSQVFDPVQFVFGTLPVESRTWGGIKALYE
jgi:hypothetical protein